MVDVTLACLAALLAASPGAAGRSDDSRPVWAPAASLDEVVIRAQSADSPFYEELPPAGGEIPQYPYTPGGPTSPVPGTAIPGNPPEFGSPYGAPAYTPPGGFGAPGGPTPYDPFTAQPQAPPGGMATYGVNGPQPFRFGPAPRLDLGYIAPADATGGYGELEVLEIDFEVPIARPLSNGDVFTVTPQYNTRLFDGPVTPPPLPGFPNDLYRFGMDFEYAFLNPAGRWAAEVGFNPSINTDFEKSLTSEAFNWDAQAVAFYKASPTLTVALGALYWDRVDDRILPYAGVILTPSDRWELRLVFPDPRVTYFLGHMWGKPTWVYARAEYNVEAYEVEVPAGNRGNQVELEDWRVLVGARKEQGWGDTFLEAGWVFDRDVEYEGGAPGFSVQDAFIFRGGVRF
jgi:hypothetical protein